MKFSKVLFSLLLFLLLGSTSGWGDTKEEATFSAVKGRVKVLNPGGQARRVRDGQAAYPGETIQVGSKATAHVNLPDGSTLNLSPDTHLTIASLKQPSSNTKVFLFRLGLGKVFAQVRKLMSAKSSFEVEAGGVVCGVRGTEFSMGFNPDTKQLDLTVFGGAVGALGGGVNQVFTSGQQAHFESGHWDGKIGSAPPPPKDNGKDDSKGSTDKGGSGDKGSNGSSGNGSNGTGSSTGTGDTTASNGTGGTDNTTTTGAPGTMPESGNTQNTSNGDLNNNIALGDLNNQFVVGVIGNGENNLNQAKQTINIHLVVP